MAGSSNWAALEAAIDKAGAIEYKNIGANIAAALSTPTIRFCFWLIYFRYAGKTITGVTSLK